MREKINPQLVDLAVPLSTLKEDQENARRHPDRNIVAIMASLREYGQQRPILVDQEGIIVAGNGTYLAARRLGWEKIAAVKFDQLDSEARRMFSIADNHTAELAEWNYEVLARKLAQQINLVGMDKLEELGWATHEIEPLLAADWTPKGGGPKPLKFTEGQYEVAQRAIEKMRGERNDPGLSPGTALSLIAQLFLQDA